MSSHQPQYYAHPPPPLDSVRLPSIKDLNFPPPGQDGAPPATGPGRTEHSRQRHDPTQWHPRSGPTTAPPHPPHTPHMPPPHDLPSKTHQHQYSAPSKPDPSYAPPAPSPQPSPAGLPAHSAHNGVNVAPHRPEKPADPPSQRNRSQSTPGVSPQGRPPHTPYPPYPQQQPPPAYHPQGHPAPPPPPEHTQQQPPPFAPPGYFYAPSAMPPRHYPMAPPPPPAHHQAPPPPNPYPPPPEHWQHPPQPQQQPQQQPPPQGYTTRTTPLVPATVEARPPVPTPAEVERATARQHLIAEILNHCGVLYSFANHYTQLASSHTPTQPTSGEVEEMNKKASTVVRLLEDLRRIDSGEDIARKDSYPAGPAQPDEQARPPKRPWEDMTHDGESAVVTHYETGARAPYPDEQAQSTAEQDMQIIRNKRQSSTGGAVPGQQKNKYRKRSRATPPGKCHSCNIRETPEWRRGPDGARTLCNACGLHYAKLMRKRDKTLDANGKAPPIDLQTLRASTASARGAGTSTNGSDHAAESTHPQTHTGPQPAEGQSQQPPSYEQSKQTPPSHPGQPGQHAGPYQLMPVGPPSAGQPHQMMPPPHSAGPAGAPVPPPPWLSGPPSSERGAYNAEPQSYVRASHPPSHARASPA